MQQTLATVAACLKPGGVCLATVVDARALAQLAAQSSAAQSCGKPNAADVSFGNGAFEVRLTAAAAQRLQALAQGRAAQDSGSEAANGGGPGAPWGVEYLFSLGDAVQRCPEFAVPLPALAALASKAGLDLVHAQVSININRSFFKVRAQVSYKP